jgi:hypothetical protein
MTTGTFHVSPEGMRLSITDTSDLFEKLTRTFYRRSVYGEYQVDWVFDFAITAWHLTDWLALDSSEDLTSIRERLRAQCPELGVCELICNGAKHLNLRDPRLRPFDVAKDVQVTDNRAGISRHGLAGEGNFDIVLTPSVVVTDKNGAQWDAIKCFHAVLIFWANVLGRPI